jgi:tellurite resistance protein TehA-like permease
VRWLTGDALRSAVGAVRAGSFTVVMATGITSAAMRMAGLPWLADVLLVIAAASFVLLAAALIAGCWRNPALAVDRSSPAAAFAAFAFTAACAVLGRGLVAAGLTGPALVPAVLGLAVLGVASWVALTVIVPVRMAVSPGARPVIADVAGTWYLWAVATQSLAIMAVFLHAASILAAQPAAGVALCAWLAGIVIYLATTPLEVVRLQRLGPGPAGSRASYWVAMGAASISALAGAEVLNISTGATVLTAGAGARTAICDTASALWAVASCLLLVLAWRTAAVLLRAPFRPRYRPGGWLVVFPLGMYATASMQLGQAAGIPWMHGIGTAFAWVAVTVWAAVFATMAAAAARLAASDSRARVSAGQRGPGPCEQDGAAHERSLRK